MDSSVHWKRLARTIAFDSKFVKVYEDKVELPNGTRIDDYTVVEKPSIAIVVATDEQGNVLTLNEYKYAADKVMRTLPAGHKNPDESAVECARRELLEETGYGNGEFQELAMLYDYPTKDLHTVYVIRATNVKKVSGTALEETESMVVHTSSIAEIRSEILAGKWQSSIAISSLTVAGILF